MIFTSETNSNACPKKGLSAVSGHTGSWNDLSRHYSSPMGDRRKRNKYGFPYSPWANPQILWELSSPGPKSLIVWASVISFKDRWTCGRPCQSQLHSPCVLSRFSCDPMDCSLPGSSVHGFPRQEYWSRLPCPPLGNLPVLGIELMSLTSLALAGRFFTTSTTWVGSGQIPWLLKQVTNTNITGSTFSLQE